MKTVEQVIQSTIERFNIGISAFRRKNGIRANSVFAPVTFNNHNFFSGELQLDDLHLYSELFHEGRFEKYWELLDGLTSEELETIEKVSAYYASVEKLSKFHTSARRPSLLFCALFSRFWTALSKLQPNQFRPSDIVEFGPGNLSLSVWFHTAKIGISKYTVIENALALFIFQNVLLKFIPQGPEKISLNGYFDFNGFSNSTGVVIANHCLNEMDPAALTFYLKHLTQPICGIGFGGKRYLDRLLVDQIRDLLIRLSASNYYLALYVDQDGGRHSQPFDRSFFCLYHSTHFSHFNVYQNEVKIGEVAKDQYRAFINKFDFEAMEIVADSMDFDPAIMHSTLAGLRSPPPPYPFPKRTSGFKETSSYLL